jgi:hypothetical protein
MIKMWGEDLELQTTKVQQEWSHLFVQCPWDLMKDGIKSSSICQILQEELMVPIILKLWEYKYMPIVELEEFTSQIDYIVKKNSHQNLNFSYQFRNNNDNTEDYFK